MPTESSVVARLIHDVSTRSLPVEPADSFLFENVPVVPAPQAPRPVVIGHAPAQTQSTAPKKSRRGAAWKPKSDAKWLQLAVAMLLVGGWAYVATQIDFDYGTTTAAAAPAPITVAPSTSAAPAAIAAPVASPAPAVQAPISVTPIAPEPTVAPEPAAQPPTVEASAPAPKAKKHRAKRAVAKAVKPATEEKSAQTTSEERVVAKPAKATPEPVVAPPPPAPVAAPAKPVRQSMDSENPLK